MSALGSGPRAGLTREVLFHPAGYTARGLNEMFVIRAGFPADDAVTLARNCTSFITALMADGINNGSFDPEVMHAADMLSRIATACLDSVEGIGAEATP